MTKTMKNFSIYPIYLPWGGCPTRCIYCQQPLVTGIDSYSDSFLEKTKSDLKNLSPDKNWEIAFYGCNFPGLPLDFQESFVRTIKETTSFPINFRIDTHPKYIDFETVKRFKKWGVRTVEIGVQTSNDEVLKKCKREHTFSDVIKATKIITENQIDVVWQIMVGLPGDNLDSLLNLIDSAHFNNVDMIRIAPTLVLKDTPLSKWVEQGEYTPLTLEEAVKSCALLYQRCLKLGIKVIRMGMALSDENGDGLDKVFAGPHHPCFKLLVESFLAKEFLKTVPVDGLEIVEIHLNPKDESSLRGWKNQNLEWWKTANPTVFLTLTPTSLVQKGYLKIEGKENCWLLTDIENII